MPPAASSHHELEPLGWDDAWAEELQALHPDAEPARVTQHHGAGLVLASVDGERQLMFTQRLSPEPTVGDWVAVLDDEVVAVLPPALAPAPTRRPRRR